MDKLVDLRKWFVDNIGLENMVVISFVLVMLGLVRVLVGADRVIKVVNGFTNVRKLEGFTADKEDQVKED